jgi:dephospho-CoA kinase
VVFVKQEHMLQLIVMKVIGLTGPTGAGKDEVARILRRRGASIIDADKLAHTLYVYKSPLWKKIVKAFGSEILTKRGEINRKKLGSTVFSDRRKLIKLNKLVHPVLKKEIVCCLATLDPRPSILVINAAVLKEIGLVSLCDEVWLVWALRKIREKRSGCLIKFQMSKKDYLKFANVVIENNGTKEQLRKKVLKYV